VEASDCNRQQHITPRFRKRKSEAIEDRQRKVRLRRVSGSLSDYAHVPQVDVTTEISQTACSDKKEFWPAVRSKIDLPFCPGPRTAQKHIALLRRLKGIGLIFNLTANQCAFTAMTDACSARPLRRHIGSLGQFRQTTETVVPRDCEAAPCKRNLGPVPILPLGTCSGIMGRFLFQA
jgi:hypothetical protein